MDNIETEIVRTSLYLPQWLLRELKLEGVNSGEKVNTIVLQQLARRYPDKAIFFGLLPETIPLNFQETSAIIEQGA